MTTETTNTDADNHNTPANDLMFQVHSQLLKLEAQANQLAAALANFIRFYAEPEGDLSPDDRGNLLRAVEMAELVTAIVPDNWSVCHFKGLAYQRLGMEAEARTAFAQFEAGRSECIAQTREDVRFQIEGNEPYAAVDVATEKAQMFPCSPEIQVDLATALLMDSRPEAALTHVKYALAVAPEDKTAQALREDIEAVLSGAKPQPSKLEELAA